MFNDCSTGLLFILSFGGELCMVESEENWRCPFLVPFA